MQDLVDRHHDRLYAFARRHATASVAEDAVQEAFLRVLAHPRLEEMDISISYLVRVVHNLLRRRHARLMRLHEILEMDVKPRAARRDRDRARADREDEWSVSVDHDLLERAMSHLSADERASIRFIVCEGRSYAEAARSLGVSITTINNWKHRGLRKLRQAMIREENRRYRGRDRAG